jgi:lysophospholipase L1-like esterase
LKAKQTITFVGSAPPRGPLTVDGVPFPRANEGVGGRRIADIAALIPSTLDENQPNVILLHIGTTDLSSGATSMTRQLGALLDKILQARPSALLVLARIIPSRLASSNATIAAYNESMPALVDARVKAGKHIVLVDMHAAFTANASYASALLYDDYHPRDAGYSLMANTWYSAIKDSLH